MQKKKEFKKKKVFIELLSFFIKFIYKGSRMVFDEVIGDYAPRWGSKSVKSNKEKAEIIMEVKEFADPYADPFKKKSL